VSTFTVDEWKAEAIRLFGEDHMAWRFVCPSCGHVASTNDYHQAGAPSGAVAFSCVGRWTGATREFGQSGPGPCNYAGGGLIRINPVVVTDDGGKEVQRVFDFAAVDSPVLELAATGGDL